jgi:hypothetical protein
VDHRGGVLDRGGGVLLAVRWRSLGTAMSAVADLAEMTFTSFADDSDPGGLFAG